MKEKEIKQLKVLFEKYLTQKYKHESALGSVINKLQEVTGKEIQFNEFPGDGLGVVAGDSSVSTYMSFKDAVSLIKEKGTIDESDFTYL